jgi:stress-induced morphogen
MGTLRRGIDPLHLYVTLVSLAYFHKSNAYTLSRMFDTEMLAEEWQAAHRIQAHELVSAFLKKGSVLELDAGALGRGDVYTV